MIQNTHWKQLARNWASILFGNALYSLAGGPFPEPSGAEPIPLFPKAFLIGRTLRRTFPFFPGNGTEEISNGGQTLIARLLTLRHARL